MAGSEDDVDSKFDKPGPDFARPGDLDDLHLLPRRFDLLAAEVRDGFEMFGNRIMPALDKIRDAIEDLGVRVTRIERDMVAEARARKRLEERVDALESPRPAVKRARK